MSEGLIDNDILHKAACYGVIPSLLGHVPLDIHQYRVLGAARYVVRRKLKRRPPQRGADTVIAEFEREIARFLELEPTDEEVRLAAELEAMAQSLNVSLDVGESLLCAVITARGGGYILTGDKRAITAIEVLLANGAQLSAEQRLVCLEQLFVWMIQREDFQAIRDAVCLEREVDTAIYTCFSCNSDDVTPGSCEQGLGSYIVDLRASAPRTLLSAP